MRKYCKPQLFLTAYVALVVGSLFAVPHLCAQTYVYGRASFLVGSTPAAVLAADFNEDQRPDLAISNFSDDTISILLATSIGGFAPKIDVPTGHSPSALVTADFNGDKKPDIAVVNENDGTISVLLGNGDGTFQAHVDYPVGEGPMAITAADFNGDGKIDLAVAVFYDDAVTILLGNGDGTFQAQALVPVGVGPNAIAAGDFNGDGKPDLITSNGANGGTVTVLLSNGKGTFTRRDSQSGANSPALTVGDFNRDGKLDAVVANQGQQQVLLLLGNGDGSFKPPVVILNSAPSPNTYIFALAGDFNQDGKLDLAFSGVDVLLGNGDGTFQPQLQSAATIAEFTAVDLNGDGVLDLAGPDSAFGADVLLGSGNGTFGAGVPVSLAPTNTLEATVAADFNGDGKLDFAVAENNYPSEQVSVQLGNGDGSFRTPITSPLLNQASGTNVIKTADFNGDGKPDLFVMDGFPSSGFEILQGNGDGTFQAGVHTSFSFTPNSLTLGDLNGDGKADLVVTNNGSNGGIMQIYLGNGDGTFRTGAQYSVPYSATVNVVDVNDDQKQDVVLSTFNSLEVFLGKGDGTFANPISGPSANYSTPFASGDFNGDGKIDLVIDTNPGGVAFLAGNGNGTFNDPIYSNPSLQFFFGGFSAGDFNGDGRLDLASGGLELMMGNGDGTFQLPITYFTAAPVYAGFVTGDFNSDSVSDLVVPMQNPNGTSQSSLIFLSSPVSYVFPTALNFGPKPIGSSSSKTAILGNIGNSPMKFSTWQISGDFSQHNNCASDLGIGDTCSIQVSFKPKTGGIRVGTLHINDNATPATQAISLRGTGVSSTTVLP